MSQINIRDVRGLEDELKGLNSSSDTKVLSLVTSGWQQVNEFYQYAVSDADVKATSWISSVFKNSDSAVVTTAGIKSKLTISEGSFVVEADKVPTANLELSYRIFSGGSAGSGTVSVSSSDIVEIPDSMLNDINQRVNIISKQIAELPFFTATLYCFDNTIANLKIKGEIEIVDNIAPDAPVVTQTIYDNTTSVTGSAEAGSTITITS
jgi:hypothetical protein